MNKKKKVAIAVLLIVIFAMCFIPPKSNNSKYRLNILSSYGDTEAYHPKVLSFKNKWNGYKYWMSYTPYPKGTDSKENPHIAVSNDLINWSAPAGKNVPLDTPEETISGKKYNSDSHIVYNDDNSTMYCYWRYVDDIANKVYIYRKESKDGVNWTPKIITAMSNDREKKDYISPAIIYEDGIYKMWYVDSGNIVTFAISDNGIQWKDKNIIDIRYEKKLMTWHLDVIHTKDEYEMLVVGYDKWANRNDMNLYYTSSTDGINWEVAKTIIKPTVTTSNWDNKGIYRSSFIYENGVYYVYYGGTSKKYNHGVGFSYGKDIFNLHSTNTNFKNKNEVNKLIRQINDL